MLLSTAWLCVCAYRYQCRQAAQQGCTYDNRMAAFCAMSAQLFVPIVFSKVGTGDGQVRDSRPATAVTVTVGFSDAERVQTRVLLDALFTYCVCCAAPCSFQCAAAECAGTPGCSFPVTPSADCSLPSMFQVMITGVVKPVRLAVFCCCESGHTFRFFLFHGLGYPFIRGCAASSLQ